MALAIMTPVIIGLLFLTALGSRAGLAHVDVQAAAGLASRSASIQRSASEAQSNAQIAANVALEESTSCSTVSVSVNTDGMMPGGSVTATVECVLKLSDISFSGIPGRMTVTKTSSSPVDMYRGE